MAILRQYPTMSRFDALHGIIHHQYDPDGARFIGSMKSLGIAAVPLGGDLWLKNR
jgi:hypothetical protein